MWYELELTPCAQTELTAIEGILETYGMLSLTCTDPYDNPIFEPAPGTTPLWDILIIKVLFATREQAQACSRALSIQYPELIINLTQFADKDWVAESLASFKPQVFGSTLWICPSWITPPQPEAVNVLLDPGLAFGTGHHETTALCLEWLDQNAVEGLNCIDYGCGSGILALAAMKLGALQVWAVDLDEQALQATESNAKLNQIDMHQLRITQPVCIEGQFDLILANILLGPLLSLRDRFKTLLKPKGQIVISGILHEQLEALIAHYQEIFQVISTKVQGDWGLAVFRKL